MSETVAAGCWCFGEASCPTEESSTIVSWRSRRVVVERHRKAEEPCRTGARLRIGSPFVENETPTSLWTPYLDNIAERAGSCC